MDARHYYSHLIGATVFLHDPVPDNLLFQASIARID
jgi:hypothetical protein